MTGKNGAAGRARFDKAYRKPHGGVEGGDATAGEHEIERAAHPLIGQLTF